MSKHMSKHMKPGPFEALLERARELDIDTTGFDTSEESTKLLRQRIADHARVKQEMTNRIAPSGSDEKQADDNERVIMVRLVEWTEWMPSVPDKNIPQLGMSNGVTGFAAGKTERLLEVGVSGTGQNRKSKAKHPETGDEVEVIHGLYAFQAVLAQEVSASVLEQQRALQAPPEEAGRDKAKDLIITDRMPAPNGSQQQPNRKQRRENRPKR